jgi:transposase
MPMPLSAEMREKIIYHKKAGAKNADIIKWLRVSKNSITRIWKLYKEENTVAPKPHNKGRKPAFCEKKMEQIKSKIKEQPDITLEELVEYFNLNISISALSRKLTKLDLTFKKRHCSVKNSSVRTLHGCEASG